MKKFLAFVMVILLVSSMCGCSALNNLFGRKDADKKSSEAVGNSPTAMYTIPPHEVEKYEDVCDKYASSLKKKAPSVVKDFEAKAKAIKAKGLSKKLHNEELQKEYEKALARLAKLNAKGVSAMIEINKDATRSQAVQEWTAKLYEVYSDKAGKISKVYNKYKR